MFWGAAVFRAKVGQNLSIVPMQHCSSTNDETAPHFQMDTVAARLANQPYETPVGLFTSILGVPVFLWLIRKEQSR